MNKNKRILFILLSLLLVFVTVVFLLYLLRESVIDSDHAPIITCAANEIHVSVHATTEELLTGVTAMDAEDGDLTDNIVIENISQFIEKGKCIINYAVFDSHNHVATASRTIYFTDYISPTFEITGGLEFSYTSNFNPLQYIKAYDCIDGDISSKVSVTLLNPDDYISAIGTHPVEFRVTNSYGDVATLQTEIVVNDRTHTEQRYVPVINLSTYLVYIEQGEIIDPTDYIDGITILDETISADEYGMQKFNVDMSNFDPSVPGLYKIIIYSEYEDSHIGSTTLLVAVGEID